MADPLFSFEATVDSPLVKAWFFDETATVVDQTFSSEMNAQVAAFLAGPLQLAIQSRYTAKGRKVRYVHDWRSCNSYKVDARDTLIQWGRNGASGTAETIIAISEDASPFLRIALTTGTLIMRGLGMKISVVHDLRAVVTELGHPSAVKP